MARIRSVHPGLFTDEAFVALSEPAQVFLIGLWTEADDQGAFEWKPLTLRMRLRPTKDGDVEALLEELATVNAITSYEHGGRKYGAIRNFRRFQRPKSPNSIHPIPAHFRNYLGLSDATSETQTDKGGGDSKKGGNDSADGGGRLEDEGTKELSPDGDSPPDKDLRDAVSLWNTLAGKHGLTKVQRLTGSRRKVLQARLRECGGLDGWRGAMALVEASGFLTGREKDWAADFDFITKSKNFTKLMEGGYADRRASRPAKQGGAHANLNAAFSGVADALRGNGSAQAGPGDPAEAGNGTGDEGSSGGLAGLPGPGSPGLDRGADIGADGALVEPEPAGGSVADHGSGLGEGAPGSAAVRPGGGNSTVPEGTSQEALAGGHPEGIARGDGSGAADGAPDHGSAAAKAEVGGMIQPLDIPAFLDRRNQA